MLSPSCVDQLEQLLLTQFSGSLSDQEQNGAVHINQEESIMGDVSECMLDDGGETSSESECLSGKSGKSKLVLQPQPRNAKGHCVPRKQQIQSSSEGKSDVEQNVCAGVGGMSGAVKKHTRAYYNLAMLEGAVHHGNDNPKRQ